MAHGRKTGGRTVGTPNKATQELRDQLQQIIETTLNDLPATLAAMEPAERVRLTATLLPYILPKLTSMEVKQVEDAPKGARLKAWTVEELDAFEEWRLLQDGPDTVRSFD